MGGKRFRLIANGVEMVLVPGFNCGILGMVLVVLLIGNIKCF